MTETAGPDVHALAQALTSGDRRALARAITLVESTRADHRATAEALLDRVHDRAGRSIRIGISGAPGVGKSTFIEAFGLGLIERDLQVAVLAVDPTSRRTGGSILGDKTRMEELSRAPQAFIRPSPAGATLGGVARRTREAMLLCEAAGFDVILVETVGVGQSELAVADMTDLFVLLVSPGAGDELQGIKRGIMELADLIVITKADGDLAPAARSAVADHKRALQLLRPPHPEITPEVIGVSSINHEGITDVIERIESDYLTLESNGAIARVRREQNHSWMWDEITESIRGWLATDPYLAAVVAQNEHDVAVGITSPLVAARHVLNSMREVR